MLQATYIKDTLGFKVFDRSTKQSKVCELISLLKDPDVQTFLKEFIDAAIATSELDILKRITSIEEKLGIIESEAPTIPDRLEKLEAREHSTNNYDRHQEPVKVPETKTEKRAFAIVDKLRKSKKRFLSSSEIVRFLKHEVDKECRVSESQNVRQTKKEVLEKAAEMFPYVSLDKRTHGRHEVRLVLGT